MRINDRDDAAAASSQIAAKQNQVKALNAENSSIDEQIQQLKQVRNIVENIHGCAVYTKNIVHYYDAGGTWQGDVAFMDSGTGRLLNPAASVSGAGLVDGSRAPLV